MTVAPPSATGQEIDPPLHEVTFCVVDLETTGGSPTACRITEIGAVKVRGGVELGSFQTLVDPGSAIPPDVTELTGITPSMTGSAPVVGEVLGSFLEFVGDSLVVGHNVAFDLGFLQAALARDDRAPISNPSVDTAVLARRLVRDEVPNCRLATLAAALRLPNQPCHRALADARATADLLHALLERAAGLDVSRLRDLLELPAAVEVLPRPDGSDRWVGFP